MYCIMNHATERHYTDRTTQPELMTEWNDSLHDQSTAHAVVYYHVDK